MTPERWKQIEQLYHATLKLEPGQRAAFLQEACAGDEDLRREVESLLTHEPQDDSFMESPALQVAAQAMAEERVQSLLGRQLGAYKILSLLGAGGMGEVYKAQDTLLNRIVAIKVLPRHLSERADLRQRFEREARALASLSHPHICPIHVIGKEDGIDFLVMEYVAGKTLDELIPRKGLRSNEVLKYAIQIADALATAHAAGIVHRDLKPGNIMVSESGQVKVLDFGLAKLSGKAASQEPDATTPLASGKGPRTEEGTVLGTVSYMSPEQAEGKNLDARSDIFSFGLVLYEMVTGQRAFTGESDLAILTAILREEPKPPSQIVGDIPPDLEKIIKRCLRKDRERRSQTMADVKIALQDLKEESDSGTLVQAPSTKGVRRRGKVWAVVAVVLLVVAGVAVWINRSTTKVPEAPLTAVPFTSYPGKEQQPSFSPDGNQVAFSWNGEKRDNFDIYVKLIGSPTPVPLTTNPADDLSPAFSPDGRSIGFVRKTKEHATFIVIPSIGGPERTIADLPGNVVSFAWLPDGNWIVADGLELLSIETGETRRLTSPPTKSFPDVHPTVSPDGRTVAFDRTERMDFDEIYLLDLTEDLKPKGDPRQLTFMRRFITSGPQWTLNGRQIIFSAAVSFDMSNLWRVAVSGKAEPEQLPFGNNAKSCAISKDGKRLVYELGVSDSNIWRVSLSSPGKAAGPPARFIGSTRHDFSPTYSPDGKRIAFISDRSGVVGIWVSNADGTNEVELFSRIGSYSASPCWSPDGRDLAFNFNGEGDSSIYVIRGSGGKPTRLTRDSSQALTPNWSPDGNWVYFASTRTGRSEVWKVPAKGGEAVQVTKNGGSGPSQLTDGNYVYYKKDASAWKMSVSGGQEDQVLPSVYEDSFYVVKDGIYFIPEPGTDKKYSIQFLSFATGNKRSVTPISRPPFSGFSVSPDGQSLLYAQLDEQGSDLMLVENFR